MKAEELINNNALTDITVCKEQKVVSVEIALTAVNVARMESLEVFPNALSVINERKRQIEVKGFNVYKDECYKGGQLALAASAYAEPDYARKLRTDWIGDKKILVSSKYPESWLPEMWKPAKDSTIAERKKELIKAGALILAEFDSFDRIES